MKNNLLPNNIEQNLQNKELFYQVLDQIEKDFTSVGIEWQRPNTLEELAGEIYHHINKSLQTGTSVLMNLLYRVDISEAVLKQEIATSKLDHAELITIKIITREYQKVNFKNQYNKNQSIDNNSTE